MAVTETSKEIMDNTEEMSEDMKAYWSDVKRAEYLHRVETGALTPEEKEIRSEVLKDLGFEE